MQENHLNLKQIAHDIRSPLSALAIAIQSLSGVSGPAKELLEHAYRRMEAIARDILEGTDSASTGPQVCFETLVNNLVREKKAEHAKQKLQWEIACSLPANVQISASPYALTRCLSNLMNNAAEASAMGSRVRVTAFTTNDYAVIEVIDSGEGIPLSERERILAGGHTTKIGGHGLGLSSVNFFVERAGGKLEIDNTSEGFCIRMILPLMMEATTA